MPPNPAPAGSSNIEASGTRLVLNGSTYRFLGLNAYEAATEWGVNEGCGADLSDAELDQLFSSLPPNSLVRFSAFQGTMGSNVYTHQLDWGPIDRVFVVAASYHQRLIPVIGSQSGGCDDGNWKGLSWYQGGFMDVASPPGYTDDTEPELYSYWTYLQDFVNRYKNSPALGMWEPMSEAEASTCPIQFQGPACNGHQTCPDETAAAAALRYFYDTVGEEIHALDPNHLVENGLLGGGQCGTQGSDYEYVSASPAVDVLSYHDYYGAVPIGGDQWNGLAVRFAQAAALGKPIIGGEVGLDADASPGCMDLATRNADFASKVQDQFSAGSSGLLAWDWVPIPAGNCNFDIGPTDPLVQSGGAIG